MAIMRGFQAVVIAICLAAAAGEALIESDVEKLQFGLQMKCLQAEFYKLAGYNTQLTAAQAGVASADAASFMPISGDKNAAPFAGRKTSTSGSKTQAKKIALIRIAQMDQLRTLLGARATPCGKVDIGYAFGVMISAATSAADANGVMSSAAPGFKPFDTDVTFWLAASMIEDVVVTSWVGAIPGMEQVPKELALDLMRSDSQFAAYTRTTLAKSKDATYDTWTLSIQQIATKLSLWRDKIDKKADLDQGIVALPDITGEDAILNITPLGKYGQALSRDSTQVKDILSGVNSSVGGFFPEGFAAATAAPSARRRRLLADAATLTASETSLNYLLNLECLEASFHTMAAFQQQLTPHERFGGPASVGGVKIQGLTTAERAIPREMAYDELKHVARLQGLLGDKAIACPKVELDTSFSAAFALAAASLYTGGAIPSAFKFYESLESFYTAAFMLKTVTESAYAGVLKDSSDAVVIKALTGILSAEAYHNGIIRAKLNDLDRQEVVTKPVLDVIQAISSYRASLEGTTKTQGVDTDGSLKVVSVDSTGREASRDMTQVQALLMPRDSAGTVKFSYYSDKTLAATPAVPIVNADGTTLYPDQSVKRVDGSVISWDGNIITQADGTTSDGTSIPAPAPAPAPATGDVAVTDTTSVGNSDAAAPTPDASAPTTPSGAAATSAAWALLAGVATLAAALV